MFHSSTAKGGDRTLYRWVLRLARTARNPRLACRTQKTPSEGQAQCVPFACAAGNAGARQPSTLRKVPEGFAGRLEAAWPAVLERCVELAGGRERVTRDALVQVGACWVMCLEHQGAQYCWVFEPGSRARGPTVAHPVPGPATTVMAGCGTDV